MQLGICFCYILGVALSSTFANTVVRIDTGFVYTNLYNISRNNSTYISFLGIPYAAPPVGLLRFEAPQKYTPWDGVRNATKFGPACVQLNQTSPKFDTIGEEDCLYLNVYTPAKKPADLLPVLVFIHGGLFIRGYSNMYQAGSLLDYPVVLVTCNYRLGAFGFLSSGNEHIPGNNGLKDQLAVLQWVQRNIEAFGGDARSVTIMGQSSGSNNVHHHLLSRASAGSGLFHQAIMMSGTAVGLWGYYPKQNDYTSYIFNELLKKAKCNLECVTESIRCLKSLPYKEVRRAQYKLEANGSMQFAFRPVLESDRKHAFVVDEPRQLKYPNPNIPLLIGVCSVEGFLNAIEFVGIYGNDTTYDTILNRVLPFSTHYRYWARPDDISHISRTLKNFYFNPSTNITAHNLLELTSLFSNMVFRMPAVDASRTYPGRRYQYLYDYTNEDSPVNSSTAQTADIHGATHSDDLISIFTKRLNGSDLVVSERMVKYFTNFIRFQNPNYEGKSDSFWEPVQTKAVEYLHITKDGFSMKTGLAFDTNYTLYQSLPLGWKPLPTNGPR